MPEPVEEALFSHFEDHTEAIERYNIRFKLSEKITNLLSLRNNKSQNEEISHLHTNTQRQIFISQLVRKTKVSPANLPRDKKNKLLLNFNELLSKLNGVLVGQYLMKNNLNISKDDMMLIQNSDMQLMKIKEKIEKNDPNLNSKFCIIQGILFKNAMVFNEIVHRLCLPDFLGREVLSKLHARNHCHLGGTNLLMQFNANFYSPQSEEWIKKLSQSCLFCRLN